MAKVKLVKHNFLVDLVVYPFKVMVSVNQTNKDLKKTLKERNITDINVEETYPNLTIGSCYMFPGNKILLRLNEFDKECGQCKGVLVHEAFHATHFVMDTTGMKLSFENDEVFAYLIGFLTEQIFKELNKNEQQQRKGN